MQYFGSHIGRAEVADEVYGANFTELWISIDPDVNYQATWKRIQMAMEGYGSSWPSSVLSSPSHG